MANGADYADLMHLARRPMNHSEAAMYRTLEAQLPYQAGWSPLLATSVLKSLSCVHVVIKTFREISPSDPGSKFSY